MNKIKDLYLHFRNKLQMLALGLFTVLGLIAIWVIPIVLLGMAIKLVIYIVNL